MENILIEKLIEEGFSIQMTIEKYTFTVDVITIDKSVVGGSRFYTATSKTSLLDALAKIDYKAFKECHEG